MKLHLEAEEAHDGEEGGSLETLISYKNQITDTPSLGACRLQSLSPSNLKSLLYRTLCSDDFEYPTSHDRQRKCHASQSRDGRFVPSIGALCPLLSRLILCSCLESPPAQDENKPPVDVLYQRQLDGCLGRVPSTFYESVYRILERAPRGILFISNLLPQVSNINVYLLAITAVYAV